MGGQCSRRNQPQPQTTISKEIDVVVSGPRGLTVKMQVGTRYRTGADLRARVAGLFRIPHAETQLMCGSDNVEDDEDLVTSRQDALLGKPPQLHLVRVRRQMAISGSQSGSMLIWDVERGEIARNLPSEHLHGVWGLEVEWHSQRLVSCADDKTLKIWDLDRNNASGSSLRGHTDGVTCLSVDWNEERILSGSMDHTMKQWDMKARTCIKTFTGHENGIHCLSVDWTALMALSGSYDKTLKLWDLTADECIRTLEGHDSFITCLRVDWTSRRAISGARGNKSRRPPRGYERLLEGGSELDGENLKLWDIDNGECLKTLKGHELDIMDVAMDWTSKRAITAGADKVLKLWDLDSGEVLITYEGHRSFVSCVRVDWAAQRIVSGSGDSDLRLWSFTNGECISIWKNNGHESSMGRGHIRTIALEPFPS